MNSYEVTKQKKPSKRLEGFLILWYYMFSNNFPTFVLIRSLVYFVLLVELKRHSGYIGYLKTSVSVSNSIPLSLTVLAYSFKPLSVEVKSLTVSAKPLLSLVIVLLLTATTELLGTSTSNPPTFLLFTVTTATLEKGVTGAVALSTTVAITGRSKLMSYVTPLSVPAPFDSAFEVKATAITSTIKLKNFFTFL